MSVVVDYVRVWINRVELAALFNTNGTGHDDREGRLEAQKEQIVKAHNRYRISNDESIMPHGLHSLPLRQPVLLLPYGEL
ncbi:hypothetical protein Pmani_023326 [Petrolisthes manimaculis]|uniref:Uncharacterized protein n=1 Tax=Petrolisthes manimaculis TaxID=1843537 RepID=A0AAE1TZP5_9EUCA|nr:hypothetical protein Pmani_023326 [Petrolisthes manimaculis]